MDPYALGLYAHFLAIVGATAAATLLHSNLARLRRATQVSEARGALTVIRRITPYMPGFALALLGTGGFLIEMRWTWHVGWVLAGIVGLLSMPVVSVVVQKPRLSAWAQRLRDASDGPLDVGLARAIQDPVAWGAVAYNHVMVLAIMFVMVMKPTVGLSFGTLLLAPAAAFVASRRVRPKQEE